LFGNVLQSDDQTGFKGPDGMKFGLDGRLYCTVYGQRNVTVLDKTGKVAERLSLDGPCPTNLAFARSGKKILVTEVSKGQVESIDVPCDGLPLFYPKTS
jgi:gluconolactonase